MQLRNSEIYLKLLRYIESNPFVNHVPCYNYAICEVKSDVIVGFIDLRVGYNENTYYGGNIGYSVHEHYRGNHYAGKACLLLFEFARKLGMSLIIITCNPDNIASRKTCEYIGAELDKIVNLPPHNDMYKQGETQKCIYRVNL